MYNKQVSVPSIDTLLEICEGLNGGCSDRPVGPAAAGLPTNPTCQLSSHS